MKIGIDENNAAAVFFSKCQQQCYAKFPRVYGMAVQSDLTNRKRKKNNTLRPTIENAGEIRERVVV